MQAVLDWRSLLPDICARGVWLFDVPVGDTGARASHSTPHAPYSFVAGSCMRSGSTSATHLAKILVYTLGVSAGALGSQSASGENGADKGAGLRRQSAERGIETFCLLFEHYFHATSSGECALACVPLRLSGYDYARSGYTPFSVLLLSCCVLAYSCKQAFNPMSYSLYWTALGALGSCATGMLAGLPRA